MRNLANELKQSMIKRLKRSESLYTEIKANHAFFYGGGGVYFKLPYNGRYQGNLRGSKFNTLFFCNSA